MGRQNRRSKKSATTSDPSAITTRTPGASSLPRSSTHKSPCVNRAPVWPPSSAYSVSKLRCSHGPGNLPTYHQCITGSKRVRGSGTQLSTMFKESFNVKRAMLMSSGPPLHRINPDRRYGSPPRTSSYASPAGSWVPSSSALSWLKARINLSVLKLKLPRIHPAFHVSHLKTFHSPVSSTEPGTSKSQNLYKKNPVKFSCKGEVLRGLSDSSRPLLFTGCFNSLSEAHSQLYKHLRTSRPESANKSFCVH